MNTGGINTKLFFIILTLSSLLGACNRAEPRAEAKQAQPRGIRAKLSTVRTNTVEDSSEFIANLESRRSVNIQPRIQGQVSQIFVLTRQNLQVGIGRIGQAPAPEGQMYQIDLQAQGRLKEPEEFENLILKTGTDGTFEWTGISLEELESGGQAPIIFGLGLILVFLVLAAQYENFVDPLIILLSVPLAILGALLAQSLRGLANDVYCQIGLVMLIGLASKNAIQIVEFANQLREQGLSITKAVVEAAESRLRPILMTALAFILGIIPLVVAKGAGAGSRQSLGTAVFGGMIVSTLLSLFIVPILYILIITGYEGVKTRFKNFKFPSLKKKYAK